MTQVHKENLASIENALPNRAGLEVEIFGMEGIPDDIVTAHQQRVIGQFAQAEAERRAATGNAGPGGAGGGGVKKPKFESPSDLKKRLAEHKAKKAAESAAGIDSGDATPSGAGYGPQSPGQGFSTNAFVSSFHHAPTWSKYRKNQGHHGYQQGQMQHGPPPNMSAYPPFSQPYGQQPGLYQPQQSTFPPQQQPPPVSQAPPGFGSPGLPAQFQNNQKLGPPQQFNAQAPGFSPSFQGAPPQPFNSTSPPQNQQHQLQPPRNQTPPQTAAPTRATNLPPAPGLPQRPSVGAPPVNAFQMQQMHQGQLPGPTNNLNGQHVESAIGNLPVQLAQPAASIENASSLDDLISGAANDAKKLELSATERKEDKKSAKKEKDKNTKLIYSDNEISPEEKMAQLPRYAFVPNAN